MATTPKDPEAQESSHLVRSVVANLKISFLEPLELKFRRSLLLGAEAALGGFTTAQIIRLYEAACEVKFASDDVKEFRMRLQTIIAKHHDLKRFKTTRQATPSA
jgi:hypothetical protein